MQCTAPTAAGMHHAGVPPPPDVTDELNHPHQGDHVTTAWRLTIVKTQSKHRMVHNQEAAPHRQRCCATFFFDNHWPHVVATTTTKAGPSLAPTQGCPPPNTDEQKKFVCCEEICPFFLQVQTQDQTLSVTRVCLCISQRVCRLRAAYTLCDIVRCAVNTAQLVRQCKRLCMSHKLHIMDAFLVTVLLMKVTPTHPGLCVVHLMCC